jgi:hypothetical protein
MVPCFCVSGKSFSILPSQRSANPESSAAICATGWCQKDLLCLFEHKQDLMFKSHSLREAPGKLANGAAALVNLFLHRELGHVLRRQRRKRNGRAAGHGHDLFVGAVALASFFQHSSLQPSLTIRIYVYGVIY